MANPEPTEELLTPAQASALIGIHPDTLGQWARAGVIRSQLTRPGGHRRYRRSDVDALTGAASPEPTAAAS